MSTLNVTIVQSDLHWQAPDRNLQQFTEILARQEGATDIVILPEMFATGFTMNATIHAEKMDGRSIGWMRQTAKAMNAAVCGSLIIEEDGSCFNRFVLMKPDGQYHCYDKRHRFRLAGEHRHYSAGSRLATIEFRGWRIRPMVCYDLRFPVWTRSRNDYDLLIFVANWPDRRHLAWETLIRARAIENLSYVAGVNRVGTDGNGASYRGGSAIIDYLGNYLVAAGDETTVASSTLALEPLEKFRERFPFHLDADAFSITDQTGS